jgi:hypothetical protein
MADNKLNESPSDSGATPRASVASAPSGFVCHFGITDNRLVRLVMSAVALVGALGAVTVPARAAEPVEPLAIGPVTLIRDDVFTQAEVDSARGALGFLKRLSNGLHPTTSARVIRHELLFREGERFRPDLLAETERNLRALGFLAEVAVAPVDTAADGRVAVRVATRDAWTLKSDVTWSLDASGEAQWTAQFSDVNFLGQGVTAGVGVGRDLTSDYWNVWYRQRRVAGTGLTLGLDYADRTDGSLRRLELSRPFYALDDAFGVEFRAWDTQWRNRFYLSNAGPAGVDPERPASLYASLPYADRAVEFGAQARLSRREVGRVWRLGLGARVQERLFTPEDGEAVLSDGRRVSLDWLAAPGQAYAREQGTTVFPYLWLRTQGRQWVKARHALRYGSLEDLELGWDVDLRAGPAGGELGSTTAGALPRWRVEARVQRWSPLGPGYALLIGEGEADFGEAAVRNHRWNLAAGYMAARGAQNTPWLTRLFVEAGRGTGMTGARPFLLGSARGMRTLSVDGMAGDRLLRANAELGRATDIRPLGVFRLGVAAFAGAGSAWWADESRTSRDLRRELGVGLRFGPVRSGSSELARVDLAWSLDGGGPEIAAVTGGLF